MSEPQPGHKLSASGHIDENLTKDVAKLASATTVAAAITILATPIITRIFSADDFGTAAIFISVSTIIGIVACLRYELAILLPRENSQAAAILVLCFVLSITIGVVTAGGLIAYHFASGAKPLPWLYWLLPLAVILNGFNAALIRWNSRKRCYGTNSIARVAEVSATSTLQVGAGLALLTSSGALVFGYLGGRTISLAVLFRQSLSELSSIRKASTGKLLEQFARYKNFPLVDSFSAFTNTASTHLPPLLLGLLFSPAAAGFYALGYRLIQLPMTTMGNAVAQVYFQRFTEFAEQDRRTRLTLEVIERLVILSLLPMTLLGLLGQEAFRILFGSQWAEAGIYAEILSIWGFFWLISSPLSVVFTALEQLGQGLKINLIIFASRLISLLIGALVGDARLAILLFSFSGAVVFSYLLLRVLHLTKISIYTPIGIIARQGLFVVPAALLLLGCKSVDFPDIYLLIIASLLAALYFTINHKKLTKFSVASPRPNSEI